jgi:hypothetical protein
VRIAATLDQRQAAWLFDKPGPNDPPRPPIICQVRLISDVSRILETDRFQTEAGGSRVLPSPALGFQGGGSFEVDSKDQSGRVSKRPQFNVRIFAASPTELAPLVLPGERVKVRFKLQPRPLLAQWFDRLEREIQGRVHL